MLDRRHRRWAGVVQMLYKYFVFSGYIVLLAALRPGVELHLTTLRPVCGWFVYSIQLINALINVFYLQNNVLFAAIDIPANTTH